jgi:hypothetical protein
MTLTKAGLVQPMAMTTIERDLLALAGVDSGRLIYNETTKHLQQWDGLRWVDVINADSALAAGKLTGVVSGALVDAVDAAKLTGVVSGALVDSLDGTKLTGSVNGSLVTQLAASKLTGDIDGGVY